MVSRFGCSINYIFLTNQVQNFLFYSIENGFISVSLNLWKIKSNNVFIELI